MSKLILSLWNKSIRYQLVFGVGVVFIVLISLFISVIVKEHSDFLHEEGLKEAKNRGLMLAANSKVWVMSNDYVGLEEVIDNFTIYDDLVFTSVINMDGKVIAHTNHDVVGKFISDEPSISYLKNLQTNYYTNNIELFSESRNFIDLALPINHNNNHIGWVHLRINQDTKNDIINKTINQSIIFIIVALLIYISFAFFTANSLTNQLLKLIDTMQKVRHGHKYERAIENGVTEVVKLSREFNKMLESLNTNEKKLEHARDELQKDISERKKVEKKIRHLNENLELIVANRTKELVTEKNRAQAANKSKSVFLSNMSHELRTPLNAILGFSQLISDAPYTTKLQKKNLNIIIKSGTHLLSLINDILDMSKIEADRMKLNEIDSDLYKTIGDIADMVRLKADNKNLKFTLEMDDNLVQYINIDDRKLRQILINIINNSIKYTDDGYISLRVKSKSEDKKIATITFEIEDSGRGMSEDELKSVFEPFVQVSSSHGITEGTGLGLTIAHSFLKLMNADVNVKSKVNHGTTFSFTIIVNVVNSSNISVETVHKKVIGIEQNSKTFKMLIVEDQKENRLLLHSILDSVGFDVYEAVNGEEAVEQFSIVRPDLIWMDMRMPIMDGYEATQKIRRLSEDVIIVSLTASVFYEERQSIMDVGCNELVHKPYTSSEIFNVIEKYLDVSFVFEETVIEEDLKKPDFSKDQLEKIPHLQLEALRTALISLNPDSIMKQIKIIKRSSPALADNILLLADNYEYGAILKLLEDGN